MSVAGPLDPLLSTGVFAHRSRLSMKALRLYERQGLLRPAQVDPHNGYRRYRESQLRSARLIVMMRGLGMPLARVADVLSVPGSRGAELVAAYWTQVEHRVVGQRELAAHLGLTLGGQEGVRGAFEIRERVVPEQLVLTEQRHVRVEELAGWIGAAMSRLYPMAARYGGAVGNQFVVYHGDVNEDSDGPAEACVPIDPAHAGSTAVPMRVEPAHREAYVRLRKARVGFPQIMSAYDAVSGWVAAHAHRSAGCPREVYFTDFVAAAPADEVCDVAFPIR